MFRTRSIPLSKFGGLSRLVSDYLDAKPELQSYYSFAPNLEGFKKLLATNPYQELDRGRLSSTLLEQASSVSNSSEKTVANIKELKKKSTYTITTGHQLCLFTGPLYFIYKIFSVINLAEKLSSSFPANKFVPVYWLAGEDHDFAEVNHFYHFGRKIEWESGESGPVGSFETAGLQEVKKNLAASLGSSAHADELLALFDAAYLKHNSLSSATRYLVNELFGKYGLVIADGNSKVLKQQFISEFRNDVFENSVFTSINKTITSLESLGYDAQVKPREINLFYMEKNLRARVEKSGDKYQVVGTDLVFSKNEMLRLVENEPQKLSPNVSLRPAYQQKILPNIAYVGGPGELAYWLEYKSMFEKLGVLFPVLVPRCSFTIVEKSSRQKLEKLGLDPSEIFSTEDQLIKSMQQRSNNFFDTAKEKEQLTSIYTALSKRIAAVDKTLEATVLAELQKTMKGLENLENKSNRAIKQKSETEISQLKGVRTKLVPAGIPQERQENFSTFFLVMGHNFFEEIRSRADVFLQQHQFLIEE